MLSIAEENYLKALLRISTEENGEAGTNSLATRLQVKPATVTDMLKKLREKSLVDYKRYGKIRLTNQGRIKATEILRKHRLWETFLYEKLDFTWDEVHEVAEQLEHIQSEKLIDSLDAFLGHPEYDPHGDHIPSAGGMYKPEKRLLLSALKEGQQCQMAAVKNNDPEFLQHISELGFGIQATIKLVKRMHFDESLNVLVNGAEVHISKKIADHIFVNET